MGTDVALAVDPNAVNQLQPIVEKKDPLIQCELCQKVFKDETELKNHKSIHAPEIVLCASCGELFETRYVFTTALDHISIIMRRDEPAKG